MIRSALSDSIVRPGEAPLFIDDQLEQQLRDRRDQMLTDVGRLLEALTPENRAARLADARRRLNATKYVQNLIRDLRAL